MRAGGQRRHFFVGLGGATVTPLVSQAEAPVAKFELAQMNVARLKAPLDSPELADFVGALDRINAVADAAPGFAWRLQDDSGNATALHPMGEDIIINMSVWQDAES